MPTIGVIDDRQEVRSLAKSRLERALGTVAPQDGWEVVTSPPLGALEDYAGWLSENDVAVLLLDQRLDESHEMERPYSGSDILNIVHPRMFDLPVYYFTAAPDATVEAGATRVRAVLDQQEFFDNTNPWVEEFVREGTRYEQQLARKLSRLGELSERAATGEAQPEELEEATSLRQELQLPFESSSATKERTDANRAELLEALEQQIAALERLANQLERDAEQRRRPTER